METGLDHEPQQTNGTHGPAEGSLPETLKHIERDLNDVVRALALLGVQRCRQCRQFFRSSEPGALFDYGEVVCFACVPNWWHSISGQLRIAEREKLEGKLSSWLRKYHRAEVVKEERGKLHDVRPEHFQIVVRCGECLGSGKLLEGERCRFCNGVGTVRIVTPE